ncbi:MAG: hypothetical protein PHV30_08960 [Candidatus Margulisbacteria bacterium]|nr:hypothetical protein [Candidatus Margulisiibacteriota bacterium]
MYYVEELTEFYKHGIEYVIVGGLAVNLYGVPRATQDIDIIISLSKKNLDKFVAVMKKLGYQPTVNEDPLKLNDKKILRDWISIRNMKAFSFFNKKSSYKVIDVVIFSPLIYERLSKKKKTIKIDSIEIYLAHIDDLIKIKSNSGREQDLSDIRMLKKIKKSGGVDD